MIIILIIITKSHYNYRSVGVMESCLLNLVILINCFLCNSTLVCSLRACHMWLTSNNIFIREIWGKFISFSFWNFEISFVSLERSRNFKKVNSVNLSQIFLLNVWLIVKILVLLSYKFVSSCKTNTSKPL